MSTLNSPQKLCISNPKGNLHVFQHQRVIQPYHLGTVMLSKCLHIRSTITLCGSQLLQKRHIFWINLASDLYKLSLITSAQDPPLKTRRDPARAGPFCSWERNKTRTKPPLSVPGKATLGFVTPTPKNQGKNFLAVKVEQWRCQEASWERAAGSCHAWTWTGNKRLHYPER